MIIYADAVESERPTELERARRTPEGIGAYLQGQIMGKADALHKQEARVPRVERKDRSDILVNAIESQGYRDGYLANSRDSNGKER
jgi:hypothetical protein